MIRDFIIIIIFFSAMTGTLRKLFHEGFLITFQKQVLAYKGNYDRKETFSFIKHICLFALYPPP